MREIVFDSSAWLEYFSGSAEGERVKEIISSDDVIYTPSICLAEIKGKYIKEGKEYKDRINFIFSRSKSVSISSDIAIITGNKKNEWNLHMVDALIYATSIFLGAPLLTKDSHFKALEKVQML